MRNISFDFGQRQVILYNFETLRKRPNELCECDWSNQLLVFIFVGCDTQSVKNYIG